MKLTSDRALVRTVAKRWKKAYFDPKKGWYQTGRADDNRAAIHEQLLALDANTATAADVAAIIGNNSWVAPEECSICGEPSWDVVQVYESRCKHEDRDFHMCPACLREGLELAGSASP